jgi:hypothetical protein
MSIDTDNIKQEISFLEKKNTLKKVLDPLGYDNVVRYILEDLDKIDDVNNTQSVYLFEVISCLERFLEVYPRIKIPN